jgi:hypothetical protein
LGGGSGNSGDSTVVTVTMATMLATATGDSGDNGNMETARNMVIGRSAYCICNSATTVVAMVHGFINEFYLLRGTTNWLIHFDDSSFL